MFEGKVSTDVAPGELIKLGCFRERGLLGIYNKTTNVPVRSFKGLRNNVELVAGNGGYNNFSGVLYISASDGVLRKSKSIPSCVCKMLSVRWLSHEECEKAFAHHTLEQLEVCYCRLREIPDGIGKMKQLKKVTLFELGELSSLPEEIGELSCLEDLRIEFCGVKNLPKKLMELKLKHFNLRHLPDLQLNAECLVVFSNLKHLEIESCNSVFAPPFVQSFWETIKSTIHLRTVELDWYKQDQKMVFAALEENGSIFDGGWDCQSFVHFFERNKNNHERTMECVIYLLAIRRCRNLHKQVPKEMFQMISMMLWNTRCDTEAWSE